MNENQASTPVSNSAVHAEILGPVLALLLLRLWLGLRAFQSGVEKFAGIRSVDEPVVIDGEINDYGLVESATEKVYSLGNMHGVPQGMYDRLAAEPLMPGFGLAIYDMVLGPLLIVLGITVLLGIALRTSLFAMGLVYTSLTFGLILLGQDAGIAWLGIHILLVVAALFQMRYNRFSVMKSY